MPQNYSEFQLQRNRVAGQAAQRILTRVILISVDVFKFVLEFLKTLVGGMLGK